MLTPDSYVLTAASANALDVLDKLGDHISSTSAHFSVDMTNDDTGGSGDYGVVVAPVGANEDWQMALWYDADASSGGRIKAWIDPQGDISDPIDTASGSAQSSPAQRIADSDAELSETLQSEFLVAEFANGLIVVQKADNANEGTTRVSFVGRGLAPTFDSDPDQDLDGLIVLTCKRATQAVNATARLGAQEWLSSIDPMQNWSNAPSQLSSGRMRPNPLLVKEKGYSPYHFLGMMKWFYAWKRSETILTRLEDTSGTGGLLVLGNQNKAGDDRAAIPWDPSVRPT